ncbi:MAG: response regulator, partial [Massilia sp.]
EAARRDAARIKAEQEAHEEAMRLAAEEAIRLKAAALLAEENARAEAARQTKLDAERAIAAEAARIEAERLAAVELKWIAAAAGRRVAAEKDRVVLEKAEQAAARRSAALASKAVPTQPVAPASAPGDLPAKAASPSRPHIQKSAADTVVMIADDSKVVRVKTNRLLGNNQYQVQQADDGLDAVRQIAERMPDIVITDVEMPGMDGFALTRHLRDGATTAHIPVIMITAGEDHASKAIEAGVDIVLGKPYAEDVLIAHIKRLMREGRATKGTGSG